MRISTKCKNKRKTLSFSSVSCVHRGTKPNLIVFSFWSQRTPLKNHLLSIGSRRFSSVLHSFNCRNVFLNASAVVRARENLQLQLAFGNSICPFAKQAGPSSAPPTTQNLSILRRKKNGTVINISIRISIQEMTSVFPKFERSTF